MEWVLRCGGWLSCLAVTIGPKRQGRFSVEVSLSCSARFSTAWVIALSDSASLAAARRAGRNSVSDPIPFPAPASSDDEKLARLKAKAETLADKPEFEVTFFLAKHAADVGVSPEQLEAAVQEVRKLRRKDAQAQTDREKVE